MGMYPPESSRGGQGFFFSTRCVWTHVARLALGDLVCRRTRAPRVRTPWTVRMDQFTAHTESWEGEGGARAIFFSENETSYGLGDGKIAR